MARTPGVWFRSDRGQWYTTLRGRQTPLEVWGMESRDTAIEALRKLLAELESSPGVQSPPAREPTIAELAMAYLLARVGEITPGALRNYTFAVQTHLAGSFGDRTPASVTAREVEVWSRGKPWSSSTRAVYLKVIAHFFAWCGHPRAFCLPPIESRGADVVVDDERFEAVCAAYNAACGGDFVALVRVLRETGARPSEVASLTVEDVDWENGCARKREHKTAKKGIRRVLYFTAAAMAVLEAQRVRHGSGHLFRTWRGGPYTERSIGRRMREISKRLGSRVIAYGLGRHSFATKALVNGVPDAIVAELLGHTGTAMVTRHYGHVAGQSRILREAVEKATARRAS